MPGFVPGGAFPGTGGAPSGSPAERLVAAAIMAANAVAAAAAATANTANTPPKQQKQVKEEADEWVAKKQTLGTHLAELKGEDPKRVFIARKISGMGFQSQDLLAEHFGRYGDVVRVLVAHSKVKPFRSQCAQPRIRPGSLGFVVMGSTSAVEKILAEGTEQFVAGFRIGVEPFQHISNPREGSQTTTDSTSTGDTLGSGSRSGSNGSEKESGSPGSTSNGSEEGSDKSEKREKKVSSSREKGQREKASHDKTADGNGSPVDSSIAAESSESGSGTEGAPSPVPLTNVNQ